MTSVAQRALFTLLLFLCFSQFSIKAHSDEDIEYRFERMWPQLEQNCYFSDYASIAVASDNSIYIADKFNHRIQHCSSTGSYIDGWGSKGRSNSNFDNPAGIAINLENTVYVVDSNNHRIQYFSAKGEYLGQLAGDFTFPDGIAIAPDQTVLVADSYNHRIQRFSKNGEFLGQWGSQGGENGQFFYPVDVTVSVNDIVYVADSQNKRIQYFTIDGQYLGQWGGLGSKEGQFFAPSGITASSDGTVYVTEGYHGNGTISNIHRIQHFTEDGQFISQFWGNSHNQTADKPFEYPYRASAAPDGSIFVTDNGNIINLSQSDVVLSNWGSRSDSNGDFNTPTSLAIINDTLFVVDRGNYRIQSFSLTGEYRNKWGSQGTHNGEFFDPWGITVLPDKTLLVTDYGDPVNKHIYGNHFVNYSITGQYLGQWGEGGDNPNELNGPQDIEIADDGTILVVDSQHQVIKRFTVKGQFIEQIGESVLGVLPTGVSVAPGGNIYVADTTNNRIVYFSDSGEFLGEWGNRGSDKGQFYSPEEVEISPDGTVFVADTRNHRIQYFTANGDYLGQIGELGSDTGQFSRPIGLVFDDQGSLYIADTGNNRIQKFVPKSQIVIEPTQSNSVTITHPYKAIILAGGGETIGGRTNHIWDGTWRISLKAYKALSRQAFVIHDEIKFLTAGNTQNDLDFNNQYDDLEAASKTSLRSAITEWAKDAKDVVIFLANHGGPGTFRINGNEILTGEELSLWVNELQQAIPGKVTVIIEACNSASFFDSLSIPNRYLFASAKADQPAVISNQGITSFSYFFWSEIGIGAPLKDAFEIARQAMSPVTVAGIPQNAQADTDGDRIFQAQDLDNLGTYCLGNCNITASDAPMVDPISPATATLNGATDYRFNVTLQHTGGFNSAWALVQRPDDIAIDPNRALDFEKVALTCTPGQAQSTCTGSYNRFDVAGEYRLSIYAMDQQYEVSFPETLTVTQNQGKDILPVHYDDSQAVVYFRDVEAGGQHYQAALEQHNGQFVLTALSETDARYNVPAQYDAATGLLTIPQASAFGHLYQATMRQINGTTDFQLEAATDLGPLH